MDFISALGNPDLSNAYPYCGNCAWWCNGAYTRTLVVLQGRCKVAFKLVGQL